MLQWSPLAIATLFFVLSLLLSFIAVKLYQFWRTSLMDLTSFTQILNEGIGNVAPVYANGQGLQHSLKHSYFGKKWLVQSASYQDQAQQNAPRQWLFCASDISQSLHQHESIIQQNLIRVFSHELRNSLTPMASMTDTLLCSDSLDITQTRMVLNRINKRSTHLLEFIGRYADISQLAPTHSTWFDITLLVDEAKTVLAQDSMVVFHGDKQCFGDAAQLSMVLTNLFTNAQQAS